ncbi:MAG: cytochrome c biogenesis protein ResB [Spirochaetales bacterium]|nr:cytochrome c biogenesis protein ResB [Spirochaetales bacterium]
MRAFLTFLFKLLTSVRLAVVLIALITLCSLTATFIPQKQAPEYYRSHYPAVAADAIVFSGYADFFHSAPFFILAGLFFINLSACTVNRFVSRVMRGAPRRYGPDIIHAGLLLTVIAGVLSLINRWETVITLREGDRRLFPDGSVVTLASFEYRRYPDGRPEAWISRLKVEKDGKTTEAAVEVNHPLFLGAVTLYQSSFDERATAYLDSPEGHFTLWKNEAVETGEGTFVFLGADTAPGSALFGLLDPAETRVVERRTAAPGGRIGPLVLRRVEVSYATGLQAVVDPSSWLVIPALIVAAAGLVLTVIQKLKEQR